MRLLAPPGIVEAGEVIFDGEDLLKMPESKMRDIRGDRISMIFQQPTLFIEPGAECWRTRSARCSRHTAT